MNTVITSKKKPGQATNPSELVSPINLAKENGMTNLDHTGNGPNGQAADKREIKANKRKTEALNREHDKGLKLLFGGDGKKPHPANDLSFMAPRTPLGTGIDYWKVEGAGPYCKVEGPGNYGLDYAQGKLLANEYLDYIGEHPTNGNVTLLGCIVGDMFRRNEVVERGRLTGIELGFLQQINIQALVLSRIISGPDIESALQSQEEPGGTD